MRGERWREGTVAVDVLRSTPGRSCMEEGYKIDERKLNLKGKGGG